jgi:hypothetical protein
MNQSETLMHDPKHPGETDELDDVDRLFLTRLERAPVPEALTARVLASTVARTEVTRAVLVWPWVLAGLVALGVLALAGYQLGASLATSDALDLITAIVNDAGLFASAPGDVVAALGEVIPWGLLALAGFSAALLILAAGHVLSQAPTKVASRQAA